MGSEEVIVEVEEVDVAVVAVLVLLVVIVVVVLVVVDLLLKLLVLLVMEDNAAVVALVVRAEEAVGVADGPFVQERGRMRGRALGGGAAGVSASRKPCGLVAGLV